MDIRFYNTLTHQLEKFEPLNPPNITMYNCGPTVYDYAHIGNFRAFIFADVLRRFLELSGLNVSQVMNITDVGHMTEDQTLDGEGRDKMQVAMDRIKQAKKSGQLPPGAVDDAADPYQVAEYYTRAFIEDSKHLRLKIADEYPGKMPRATQHIADMQRMISGLIQNGHAYVAPDGAVYYNVQSFPQYGALSGNTLDKLRGGAGGRVSDEHQASKRHPADFLLWKPDDSHVMKWDSPWGTGYPGWHIECSAMATALHHSEVIDIHTGGEDNIFPHHECEIAQTCGFSGKDRFARYWLHTRFLLVEGKKMSKSQGNFLTVRDLLARGADPAAIRFELLKSHYRTNMNFTFKGLEDSLSAVNRLRQAASEAQQQSSGNAPHVGVSHPVVAEFMQAMADDLNVAGALGGLFGWLGEEKRDAGETLGVLKTVDSVLAVLEPAKQQGGEDEEALALCRALDEARAAKQYDKADTIRKQLIDAGYEVKTTGEGTSVRKKLA